MSNTEAAEQGLLDEATRQFTICNACRYCEGYCPVWPAAHMRTLITNPDSVYLSNLCYDHRDCYYACPFVEPTHEFALNIPKVTRQVRKETYRNLTADFTSTAARKASLLALTIMPVIAIWLIFFHNVYSPGAFSFYNLVPKITTIVASTLLSVYLIVLMALFVKRYVGIIEQDSGKAISGTPGYLGIKNIFGTIKDVIIHRWFSDIHYPSDGESNLRKLNHALIFFGFGLDFLSTTLGFLYEDIMKIPSPYGLFSPVVMAGLAGGLMIAIGAVSSLSVRSYSSGKQDFMEISGFDTLFAIMLLLVAVTGISVLMTRLYSTTVISYTSLLVHYSIIYILFVTTPFTSNFLHIAARFTSLLKFNYENKE